MLRARKRTACATSLAAGGLIGAAVPLQEIPKDGGNVRVLSIPAIRDRVVQGALKLVLEPEKGLFLARAVNGPSHRAHPRLYALSGAELRAHASMGGHARGSSVA